MATGKFATMTILVLENNTALKMQEFCLKIAVHVLVSPVLSLQFLAVGRA